MSDVPNATHDFADTFAGYDFAPATTIVPLDGSTDSEAALAMGSCLAEAFDVRLRILHAIATEATEEAAALANFEGYVSDLAARSAVHDSRTTTEVSAGSAVEVILDAASEDDLVVMATLGRRGLKSALFGRVAARVVRQSKAPILLVPVRPNVPDSPIRNIVTAADDAESAAHAAAVARSLATKLGTPASLADSNAPTPIADAAVPRERGHVFAAPTVDATGDQDVGAGLVVARSAGRGFFGRLLMGSISEHLMHRLDRPLLILPALSRGAGARPTARR